MKVQIQGWSSRGLRCPDFKIELTNNGKPAKIALIQMPNGTGKTTTLEMLTATLNGTAMSWRSEEILRMRRKGDQTPTGEFKIDLLADDTPITFVLKLDFDEGTAKYTTTSPYVGGIKPGWNPPPEVEQFLLPEFLRLFVFDGEFAGRLLKPTESEAEKSIDALCQLYLLNHVRDIAEKYWQAQCEKGPRTTTGLTKYKNLVRRVEEQLERVKEKKEDAEKQIGLLEKSVQELNGKIEIRMKGDFQVNEQYELAKEEKTKLTKQIERTREELMLKMRQPQNVHQYFGAGLVNLKNNLDVLKLPDITSSTFFEELANSTTCVCGRQIGTKERQMIKQRAENYLDSEETATINLIKRDISKYVQESNVQTQGEQCSIYQNELSKYIEQLILVDTKIERLQKKLADQGDEELKRWTKELQIRQDGLRNQKELLDEIKGGGNEALDISEQMSLSMLERWKNTYDKKVAEITGTLRLRQQTEIIKEMCDSATNIAREQIRDSVLKKCNTKLSQILSSDPLQLERIDKCLRLEGQIGGSVGQELSVGYAFLLTILQHGNNDFPLIVDSPAGSLDETRRKEIGNLIPEHCSQFITFLISTEREYFVNALEAAAKRSAIPIHYITAFRKSQGVQRLIDNLPVEIAQQTENSVIVPGREYFVRFSLEQEV